MLFETILEGFINFVKEAYKEQKNIVQQKIFDVSVHASTICIQNKCNISLKISQDEKESAALFCDSPIYNDIVSLEVQNRDTVTTIIITADKVEQKMHNIYIELKLPIFVKEINSTGTNGNIDCSTMNLEKINFENTNGNIAIKNIDFTQATLKTQNGNIFVKDCGGKYALDAHTNNGKMLTQKVNSSEGKTLVCKSENGNILIKG